ncbi:MAG: AbrB family transcriptional regulator [Rhodobiaceae bacterium]|nr:AbrB family transcriptional regulator [Rhodobiaceae bacterium]
MCPAGTAGHCRCWRRCRARCPYVISVAVETGADARRVAVVQALRLVVLVLVLPSLIVATGSTGTANLPPVLDVDWIDLGLLAFCGAAAALFCSSASGCLAACCSGRCSSVQSPMARAGASCACRLKS